MRLLLLAVTLLSVQSYAITQLNIFCYDSLTGPAKPAARVSRRDQTPVILAGVAARKVDMDAWRELAALNRARTERLASNGLSESAMGTKIRIHIGRIMDLLENGQKELIVEQNLWIWDEMLRAYHLNKDSEKLIEEAVEDMNKGRLKVEEGQELVATLQREIAENQLAFAEAYAYYRGVNGFLRNRAKEAPLPSVDAEASAISGAAHAKVRALSSKRAPQSGSEAVLEMVAIEPPTPPAPTVESVKSKEQKIASDAAYALKKLNDRAKTFAEMFPERNFPKEMPDWMELRDYNTNSVAQNIEYRKLEASLDRTNSFKLFALSSSLLAPLRWAVKKFLPLSAQAHVFKVLSLGEDNAMRIRYVPDIFNIFRVDSEKQIAELRDKNAPTEDQLLVAFARMFPRTYVRLMVRAREEGVEEAQQLGETVPENLTVVPKRKERPISPRLNFYYRMVGALKAAQIAGDLSIDYNNNVGQRAAVYVVGGAAGVLGTGATLYQSWPAFQTFVDSIRVYIGF